MPRRFTALLEEIEFHLQEYRRFAEAGLALVAEGHEPTMAEGDEPTITG